MKGVLPLLLLAFLLCQCNNQSGQQNQSQKSSSEQDSEKLSKDDIGIRVLELGNKLCNCDPSKANAFDHILTNEYGALFKEALALPEGIDGDGPSSWLWIEFAGELCTVEAITEEIEVDGNDAKVIWEGEDFGKDELALSFVDGEWLIDNIGNCSKPHLNDLIEASRAYYKYLDWQELKQTLMERGYSEQDAVQAADGLKEQIETYFKAYPDNSNVVYSNLRLEENAVEDGKKMLKCYFNADFPELKGHTVRITMQILDSDGEVFTYTDDEGFPVPVCDTKWYTEGAAKDDWMGIYYEELEVLPPGNYFVRFEAYDNDSGTTGDLMYSKSLPFTK